MRKPADRNPTSRRRSEQGRPPAIRESFWRNGVLEAMMRNPVCVPLGGERGDCRFQKLMIRSSSLETVRPRRCCRIII
jgi:hypothetical protein